MTRQRTAHLALRSFVGSRRLHRATALLLCGMLGVQATLPAPVSGAFGDYDALSAQLGGLVGQRSAALVQLAQADGSAGALVARDALASLVPAIALERGAAQRALARALSVRQPAPIPAVVADRAFAAGMLLGPHLAAPAAPPVAAPITTSGLSEALLASDGLAFVPAAPASALAGHEGAPLLAPATPTPSIQVTAQEAQLGDAQDTAPIHALEIGALPVSIPAVAPQARVVAPPLKLVHTPLAPTPVAVRGSVAMRGYLRASVDQRASLASIQIPDGLPSAGLDTNRRVTRVADVQDVLGHYTLTAPVGGPVVQVNAPGFLAPQVTWAFSETSPLGSTSTLIVSGNGHTDGGTLHDLALQATTLEAPAAPVSTAPGTNLSFALSPEGAAEVTIVSTITGTTTITTLARVDGVGSDPALQSALARENLALTELSGVLSAGNAVYARLQPLYQLRAQQYAQDLSAVMARNAALEQAWWSQEVAWRAYQTALARWKQRRDAWDAYLQQRAAAPSPPPAAPDTATPVPTSTMAAQALPLGTVAPQGSATPQGAQGGIFDAGAANARPASRVMLAGVARVGVTPIFGQPPQPSATATSSPAAQSAASASATASPTPPLGAPSVVIAPSETATPLVLPSPLPIVAATPVTGTVTAPVAPEPPGAPPAPVPAPGLEPAFQPLPPALPPLPPWVSAAPPVLPRTLSSSLSHGLGAFGYATMRMDQLLAGGALDNLNGFVPPLRGVITTYWGGSTPWQSFHTGIDIAAPEGTPVHAAAAGIVIYAGLAVPGDPTLSYGNCVMILHNSHLSTLYGHMEMGGHGLQVVPGQVVTQGQVIGFEGATGWATGPHVHFEMRLDNVQFDPLLLLDQKAITG